MAFALRAIQLRRISNDIRNLLAQHKHFGVRRAAQIKADAHLIADSIERACTANEARRLDAATEKRIAMQRINGIDNRRPDINRVNAQVWLRAMRRQAADFSLDKRAGRPVNLWDNLSAARHILRHNVITKRILHIIKSACLQQHQRTLANLLCRLKEQLHPAAGQALLLNKLRYSQRNRHMRIMTAGMNSLLAAILLFEQQAVHIRAHRHRRSRSAAIEHADNCRCAAHILLYRIAKLTQAFRNKFRCPHLLKCRLSHGMQLRPNSSNFLLNIHIVISQSH